MTLEEAAKLLPARDHFTPDVKYANALRSMVAVRLHAKGYLDSRVTLTPSIDESSGTVNYTIDAVPGPVYHLGLLKFENVSDALRSILMRDWQLIPGDPFDESYLSNFVVLARKNDPVLQRSLAGVNVSYDVHADPETRDVNVVMRFER